MQEQLAMAENLPVLLGGEQEIPRTHSVKKFWSLQEQSQNKRPKVSWEGTPFGN